MKPKINLLTGGVELFFPEAGGDVSSDGLTTIETLTGTSGSVKPGRFYALNTNSTFTLGIEGAIQGKAGSAMIDITLGEGGTITGASGLEIVSELKPSKINHCCVQIKNLSAQLWCYWTEDLP